MIKPGELQNKARAVGVRDQQIEKDYMLSWILQGISQHTVLSKAIVFKGGTVLKKVYFKGYRFSEDLDLMVYATNKYLNGLQKYLSISKKKLIFHSKLLTITNIKIPACRTGRVESISTSAILVHLVVWEQIKK